MLFQGNIVAGATRDTIPRFSRAKHLSQGSNDNFDERYHDEDDDARTGKNGSMSSHVERVDPHQAKNVAYGMNTTGAGAAPR